MNTVLITGASKGIGIALANIFLQENYKVIGTSRSDSYKKNEHKNLQMLNLDLTKSESIESLKTLLKKQEIKVDILINNAAIGIDLDTDIPDEKSFRETFESNVFGTVFFTEAMLELLNADAKIINVSSKMGSIDLCSGIDSVAYRMSKTALNMYSKILANRLQNKNKIATIHPGWVRTELTAGNIHAPLSSQESALSIFEFICSDFKNGVFWNAPEQKELSW